MAYAIFDINCIFTPSSSHSYHSSHHLTLVQLFSHKNTYMHSFVPATIGLWNSLDEDAVLPLSSCIICFCQHLCLFGSPDHILAFSYIHVSLVLHFQQNIFMTFNGTSPIIINKGLGNPPGSTYTS